jgi:hypothetical protein
MEETFWKQKSRCLFANSSRHRMLLSNGEVWFAVDVPLLSLCRLGEQFHSRSSGFTVGMTRKMWLMAILKSSGFSDLLSFGDELYRIEERSRR